MMLNSVAYCYISVFVPMVVPIAVRIVMSVWMTICQIFFFIKPPFYFFRFLIFST